MTQTTNLSQRVSDSIHKYQSVVEEKTGRSLGEIKIVPHSSAVYQDLDDKLKTIKTGLFNSDDGFMTDMVALGVYFMTKTVKLVAQSSYAVAMYKMPVVPHPDPKVLDAVMVSDSKHLNKLTEADIDYFSIYALLTMTNKRFKKEPLDELSRTVLAHDILEKRGLLEQMTPKYRRILDKRYDYFNKSRKFKFN